jgi:hypothetical protein
MLKDPKVQNVEVKRRQPTKHGVTGNMAIDDPFNFMANIVRAQAAAIHEPRTVADILKGKDNG